MTVVVYGKYYIEFNFILLIGEEEFKSQSIILKNLDNKSQKLFKQNEIILVNEIR